MSDFCPDFPEKFSLGSVRSLDFVWIFRRCPRNSGSHQTVGLVPTDFSTSGLTSGLGVAPIDFRKDEVVEIRGVKMTSAKTQLPYEYYSLPFCQPEGGVAYETLNLGEVLRGDRIVNTAYDVRMDQRIDCKIICEQEITEDQAEQIIQRVNENYFVHLLADNLPAVTRWELDNEIVQVILFTRNPWTIRGATILIPSRSKAS